MSQEPNTFPSYCKALMRGPLPGREAQITMDPVPEERSLTPGKNNPDTRESAVLVLVSLDEPASILYTLRNSTLLNHAGQISFPGGRQERGEYPRDTARREAAEEVGIRPHQYEVAGWLSPLFVPPSNFVIQPLLAFCDERPAITIQPAEVSEAFWVPVRDLLNEKKIKTREHIVRGKSIQVPYWDIHSVPLWGATAMITSELTTLYRRYLSYKSTKTGNGAAS